jgi:hypothetical protein
VPHDESKRQHIEYGLASTACLFGGSLEYRVDLYTSNSALLAALNGETPTTESHGADHGLTVSFDQPAGALWILYPAEYYEESYPDREGHVYLRIHGPAGSRILRGSWASDLNGKELSAGTMTMMRPEHFPSYAKRLRKQGMR